MSRNYRDSTSVTALRANALYLLVALALGAWLAWDAAFVRLATYAPFSDYWEHSAVLREWLTNFAAPTNPHVDDPSLSPRFMPWFWLLTYLGLIFQWGPVELLAWSAVANFALIVFGLHVFLNSYFRDPWAPLVGLLAVFLCWGVPWNWSNLYQLRSFFYVGAYPSSFVFGLSLISFALVMRLLRRDGNVPLMALALSALTALMFLSHPLTGVFGIVGCGLLALTESSEGVGLRLIAIAMLVAGAAAAGFWPFFSVWTLVLGLYPGGGEQWFPALQDAGPLERLRSGDWGHIFYDPGLVLTMLGPALLGVPLIAWLAGRRECQFIVLGAFIMAVPYLLHPFIAVPLAHRFLLFVVTFLHLAIVWGVLQVIDAYNSRPRPDYAGKLMGAVVAAGAALLAFNIWLVSLEFDGNTLTPTELSIVDKRERLPADTSVIDLYATLTKPLNDADVVLATPVLGWPLPTVKGKVVSIYHENPMLQDQFDRYRLTEQFFVEPLSAGERSGILRRYPASHLLIRGEPLTAELDGWLAAHARLLVSVDDYRMYSLQASATVAEPPPEPVIVVEPEPVPEPATSAAPAAIVPAEKAAPAIEPPNSAPARPRRSDSEAAPAPAEQTPPPANFGAPIAPPVLDPERNGG